MNVMSTPLGSLHLLRPEWLWALLALVPAAVLWQLRRRTSDGWRQTVDAHLLPHLLVTGGRRGWGGCALAGLVYLLAILALAGPSWRQAERPVFTPNRPLVIALDLSSSSQATDLPPSRLLQMRAKLATLLRQRAGGDVALLAYAGDSFTVAPLTGDVANVALFLDALSPSVMPVDGKRADTAIDAGVQLLKQAGFSQGDILVVSDRADGAAQGAAGLAHAHGFTVSALGVGSERGAAYRTGSGEIAQARLDEDSLRALVARGGGRYARLSADGSDLRALGVLDPARQTTGDQAANVQGGKMWLDDGYWLLLPVMALALLAFRRRADLSVLVLVCLLPLAAPARAADGTAWRRADQIQQQRLEAGVQAYRKGDFAAAQQAFAGVATDQGLYNLGNALARQGQYDAAIAAYDRALQQHPGMQDAIANRAAVEAARKRKQQGGGQQQGQQGKQGQNQQGQNQSGQGQSSAQQGNSGGQGQPPPTSNPSAGAPGQDASASATPQRGQSSASDPQSGSQAQPPPAAADAQAQQQADAAQRQRMQQAIANATQDGKQRAGQAPAEAALTPQQREQQQAVEAWIRRVPDDPGSLLRAKFKLEYERRQREGR
ncbi:VWA domain-containing protein [Xanthomonas maliensis]|uniref:VWA domain-containing protein n=1 Tax=Xanthomonas maliensis TaxID=1321368 RepID=UPI0003A27371|nr:VWA domain-containing protein [Xanthomonas maliensis]KAB7762898.1 hypothetical protein CKY51_20760 [Xanthomonas maliensis]